MTCSVPFQLVDDLLDFVSSETMMGKPTTADLRLGLATAPVLFAAEEVNAYLQSLVKPSVGQWNSKHLES